MPYQMLEPGDLLRTKYGVMARVKSVNYGRIECEFVKPEMPHLPLTLMATAMRGFSKVDSPAAVERVASMLAERERVTK